MIIGRYNIRIRGSVIKIKEILDYTDNDLELEIDDFRVNRLYCILNDDSSLWGD